MAAPFTIQVEEGVLADLQQRLRTTRLAPAQGDDWADGTSASYLRALIAYWRDAFDWRAQERALNRFAQHRQEVDGTMLHYVHERGRGPSPMPLLLSHGWPDSFWRFYKLIPLLTDPAAHGGDAADAFDVVVPSLPGYGFSDPRPAHGGAFGWGDLLHRLMTDTLGYARFGAHGGDWGSTVNELLARSHARSVIGLHLTDVPWWHTYQKPDDLSAAEQKYFEASSHFQRDGAAYAMIQGTRPRTLAQGLNDSPAGLAAWIVEKFYAWSDCHGDLESRYSKDELLTNITLYWVTQSIGSSFQPYRDFNKASTVRWMKEAAKRRLGEDHPIAGFALFPKDLSTPPREWAARFFDVRRWSSLPAGGHFAALEEPQALAEDIRAFFRPLRGSP